MLRSFDHNIHILYACADLILSWCFMKTLFKESDIIGAVRKARFHTGIGYTLPLF